MLAVLLFVLSIKMYKTDMNFDALFIDFRYFKNQRNTIRKWTTSWIIGIWNETTNLLTDKTCWELKNSPKGIFLFWLICGIDYNFSPNTTRALLFVCFTSCGRQQSVKQTQFYKFQGISWLFSSDWISENYLTQG